MDFIRTLLQNMSKYNSSYLDKKLYNYQIKRVCVGFGKYILKRQIIYTCKQMFYTICKEINEHYFV